MAEHVHYVANAASVTLYGMDRAPITRALALCHGAKSDSICLIKAPGSANDPGYQTIMEPQFGPTFIDEPDVYTEGVILTKSGSAAVITTADCPTLIMYESTRGQLLVCHAGRAAMTPTNQPGESIQNIITIGYKALVNGCDNPNVHAYITGAICGLCFVHDHPEAEKFIEPFDQFGKIAFTDRARGALDLVAVMTHQLIPLGVPKSRIQHDGLCTKETYWLTSYRKNKIARNAIVAVLQ